MQGHVPYPFAFMGAETVQMGNDVKLDVGPRGVIQWPGLLSLAHLHAASARGKLAR